MCHTEFNFPSHLWVTTTQSTTPAYRHANQSSARDKEGEPPSKRNIPDLVHEQALYCEESDENFSYTESSNW